MLHKKITDDGIDLRYWCRRGVDTDCVSECNQKVVSRVQQREGSTLSLSWSAVSNNINGATVCDSSHVTATLGPTAVQ